MIKKIGSIIKSIITFTQKILITISLFLIYILVFGIVKIIILVINKRILYKKTGRTSWEEAKGYDCDLSELDRES